MPPSIPTLPSDVISMLIVVLIESLGAPGRSCSPFIAVLLTVKCVVPLSSVVGVISDVLEVQRLLSPVNLESC